MRILFINPTNKYSGGEIILLRLVKALKTDPQFTIQFFCQNGEFSDQLKNEGYSVSTFSGIAEDDILKKQTFGRIIKSGIKILKVWKALYSFLKQNRPDVIHANLYLSAIYAVLPAYLLNIPVIWHDHTIHSKRIINRALIPIISKRVSKIIAVSDAVKRSFVSCGASESNISRIYNGVDTNGLFNPDNYSRGVLRNELGISEDRFLFGFLGVICHLKGVHNIVNAVKIVKREIGSQFLATVLLAGPMRDFDAEYHTQLKSQLDDSLSDNLIFLGPRKDVPQILKDIDCLLFTSVDRDALPTVLLEALAMGKIIIASDIGGAPEILLPEYGSLFYHSASAEELARNIIRVFKESPDLEEKTADANRERAQKLFSIDTQVLNFKKVYLEYADR